MSDTLGQVGIVHDVGWFAWLISAITRSHWNHCVTDIGNGEVISAEPGGAKIRQATEFDLIIWSAFPMTATQAQKSADFGRSLEGAGYGYFQDLFIGIAKITRTHTPRWIEKQLLRLDSIQCAQAADECLRHAGVHAWRDKRPIDAVSPADWAKLFFHFSWLPKGLPQ